MRARNGQTCCSSPPNKRLRRIVGRDLISNLHESIITHVLSRLPTKDAVRTSILSRGWRFKWHSIDNVNIITDVRCLVPDSVWKYYIFPYIYSDVIHRQLPTGTADPLKTIKNLPLSHNVRSFNFSWWKDLPIRRLKRWISAVLNLNIESFRLVYPYWAHGGLPSNLHKCSSLKILELKVESRWRVPSIVDSFSNLVDLSLHSVQIKNEDLGSDTLIFKFEVLKTFKLYHCEFSRVKFLEFHAPALTTFKWFCCIGAWKSGNRLYAYHNSHLIKIYGPQLTCFEIQDKLSFMPESTIAYATLRCFVSDQQANLEIRNRFECILTANRLMLQSNTINGVIIKQPNCLPSFHRLERLGIQFLGDLEGLLKLLQATPVLRFLEMDRWTLEDGELKTIPSCAKFFLEEIKFNWYNYRHHGFQLEKYLLKHATKLKKVSLQFRSNFQLSKSQVQIDQLSASPRAASATLQTVLIS